MSRFHLPLAAAVVLVSCLWSANALVRPDGVGKLPALGWNSWNAFGCDIDDAKIMTAAKEIVNLGLKDLGYEYINIDDCWSVKSGRDKTTKRIVPDPAKFPDGIAGVADRIHDLGLKVGIYSSAGLTTCAGYPASLGYEEIDAQTFAEWGIDYLKYDNCGVPSNWTDAYTFCVPDPGSASTNGTCPDNENPAPQGYDWSTSLTAQRHQRMRDALLGVEHTIFYSLCEWGQADVSAWGNATGNSWRMSGDITPSWDRIAAIANENSFLLNHVDFWGHSDPDMLEVGNGDLTLAENRAHFALWAAMKSPLIIGTALDGIDPAHLEILLNKYLIAFHQDPVIGRPAYPYKWGYSPDWTFDPAHPAEYWSGPSSTLDGTLVLMLNSEGSRQTRTAVWKEIPELKDALGRKGRRQTGFRVTDVWTGKDLGCVRDHYTVTLESHDVAALLVGKGC
ncbi:glycoside hydrolase family 27 protein [Aspergillus clavatus NRRL 1]|uniref:Probable alpha-galactosidase B n=1 Tax=Aspergillus clavatus (strain ATCC 1007 / CBS 513.65 / DSM 816 / NCTC 3887 / NRRL 1 / QM 1276 / 107) TaxID=344612 RepID=AGALB_ASPCL|nr:alpha-galactosidase [Aspergillus clavatus NRRL 1]A1C5D3.1 RecName: Full=Probable alpha-galactosidase B; AltName: Full=Melibiase B; Flags: Precursor [Aspergillus clavatus NRRL 1]EAW14901.1 alpha-galactosidase [Aspergillus clavatus NRRL 1]